MFVKRREFEALVDRVRALEDKPNPKPEVSKSDVEIVIDGIGNNSTLLWGLTSKRIQIKDAVLALAKHIGVSFDLTPKTGGEIVLNPLPREKRKR